MMIARKKGLEWMRREMKLVSSTNRRVRENWMAAKQPAMMGDMIHEMAMGPKLQDEDQAAVRRDQESR